MLQVVKQVSETFNYPRIDRERTRLKRAINEQFPNLRFNRMGLPPKVCKMQTRPSLCYILQANKQIQTFLIPDELPALAG